MRARFSVLATLLVLIPSLARAEEFDGFKSCVLGAGDLDGDGVPDLCIASRDAESERVWAVSGRDRTLIYALRGACKRDRFGSELARLGDLDGDGVDDLAVAARESECETRSYPHRNPCVFATVFSGKSGCVLFELEDGWSVAAAGDVDRDGVPDILLGCPDMDCRPQPGQATVRSGRDGSLLLRVTNSMRVERAKSKHAGWSGQGYFGTSVCGIGDSDGDGVPDFAVGAAGPWKDGVVYSFSGRTGAVLGGLHGDSWSANVGWTMSRCGDLDGDGRDDLLVSALHQTVLAISTNGFRPLHHVETGSQRAWLDAFGSSLDRTDDIDGDGVDDWLVGANECQGSFFDFGYAQVRSGRDGDWIRNLFGSSQHGVDVANAGDVNGDGMDDHVIVMPTMKIGRILSGRDGALLREIDLAKLRAQSNDPDRLRTR